MSRYRDPICRLCPCGPCTQPCAPLAWVGGNAPQRELILRDLDASLLPARDYNCILHRISRYLDRDRTEEIRSISDPTLRAVAALLNVGLSVRDIADLLHVSRDTVYRYVRRRVQHPPATASATKTTP